MILPTILIISTIVGGVLYIVFSILKTKFHKKNKRRNEIITEIIENRIN